MKGNKKKKGVGILIQKFKKFEPNYLTTYEPELCFGKVGVLIFYFRTYLKIQDYRLPGLLKKKGNSKGEPKKS